MLSPFFYWSFIMSNAESPKKVEVEIDISDEMFMSLAKKAHERDVTFNQLCEDAIREMIEYHNKIDKG